MDELTQVQTKKKEFLKQMVQLIEADGRACLQADIFQGGRQASELNKILIA